MTVSSSMHSAHSQHPKTAVAIQIMTVSSACKPIHSLIHWLSCTKPFHNTIKTETGGSSQHNIDSDRGSNRCIGHRLHSHRRQRLRGYFFMLQPSGAHRTSGHAMSRRFTTGHVWPPHQRTPAPADSDEIKQLFCELEHIARTAPETSSTHD